MSEKISIREFLKRYDEKEYEKNKYNVLKQCDVWYDWFCKDEQLFTRMKPLVGFLKKITKYPIINIDECYVYFKNNCPMNGPLYDSMGICKLTEHNDQLCWIGFLKAGTHGQPHYTVEVCFDDSMIPFIKGGPAPSKGDGSYDEPYVFYSRKSAIEFFRNKERVDTFIKLKEEERMKKLNIHQVNV